MTRPVCTVVLTACIQPHQSLVDRRSIGFQRTNSQQRVQDYKGGLAFWLSLRDPRIQQIIFIENTGYDLSELEQFARSRNPHARAIEFISLDCNHVPEGLNYGYAEFYLIDQGLKQSRLYPQADMVIKATGRYTFPTVSRLLNRLPEDCRISVDARRNERFVPYRFRSITTPLLLARRPEFDALFRTAYQDMKPPLPWGFSFVEDILYQRLSPLEGHPGVMLRWPVNCDPAGVGGNGVALRSPRRRAMSVARALMRVVLPGWWM